MDFKNLNKIENDFNQDQEILEENSKLDKAKLENKKKKILISSKLKIKSRI